VLAYRLRFILEQASVFRLHVTADERYILYLDGMRAGCGPERGDVDHWYFETYDVSLEAGVHMLVAQVWSLGEKAPFAQVSAQPGFLLCPEEDAYRDVLGTGRASWEVKQLAGYTFHEPLSAFAIGYTLELEGKQFAWDFEHGVGTGWSPARVLQPGVTAQCSEVAPSQQQLLPASLPPMLYQRYRGGRVRHISAPSLSHTHSLAFRAAEHLTEEEEGWRALLAGDSSLTLPPHTRRRVLIDLENYLCAYPEIVVSRGEAGSVRVNWQESLIADTHTWNKGHRGEIEDKYFTTLWRDRDGIGDSFHLDGGEHRRLTTLWWRAGRYVELVVETENQPLTLEQLHFYETRYPLEMESSFSVSDERLQRLLPLAFRTLQMCAHETYMDCPFYEQLMYVGDTRLECLLTYVSSRDDRLPRKALRLFDYSRLPGGLTQSRYPSRVRQMIPPFSLWWVAMIHDYLMWRDDVAFVCSLLPGMRAVLDAFVSLRDEDGLVRSPAGWNFMDWLPAWPDGEPEGSHEGEICVSLNWLYVYALQKGVELEQACGEAELAARYQRLARETVEALTAQYWCEEKGLYADNAEHTNFSEHSQCLAVLSRLLSTEQCRRIEAGITGASELLRPSVYFLHYYFELCQMTGRSDLFFQRLQAWYQMLDLDFKTTYENLDPFTNRSDCHAWAAHPLYHYFATILGIRPAAPGFRSVMITPLLGSLASSGGTLVHPQGELRVSFQQLGGALHATIALPETVQGTLAYHGQQCALHPGEQQLRL
jgi:hypothetical protein